jgi:uncharacterized SAM-binding protein YcdF (DUF218 family)
MPRAVGVFRKIGWALIPYPVDYQTADVELLGDWPDVAANLNNIGVALKECSCPKCRKPSQIQPPLLFG